MDWFFGFYCSLSSPLSGNSLNFFNLQKKGFRGSGRKGLVEQLLKERHGDPREDATER